VGHFDATPTARFGAISTLLAGFTQRRLEWVLLQRLGHVAGDNQIRLSESALVQLYMLIADIYQGSREGLSKVSIKA
jgi:hypothetical protein